MIILKVKLNDIDKVKKFVNIASTYSEDFDLVSDKYVVDGKSIMGIFSLNLSKAIELHINSEDKHFEEIFSEFCI